MNRKRQRALNEKRRLQLAALHATLDMLEFDSDETSLGPATKLYSMMLVGSLIRSMRGLRKSKRRAKELGIAVYPGEKPPKHEQKLLRKRIKKTPVRSYRGHDDDDGFEMI